MVAMLEQYEWCWNLGAYMDQECELCPHKDECKNDTKDEDESEATK